MLTRVTITGADDGVDPQALVDLSAEFPFVEWGILFSASRESTRRYPSHAWVDRFVDLVHDQDDPPDLAAHFCGAYTRRTLEGDPLYLREVIGFDRFQLNGFQTSVAFSEAVCGTNHDFDVNFILQVRSAVELPAVTAFAELVGSYERKPAILFDPSGGEGRAPSAWPAAPKDIYMGYAGGISPENVIGVIESVASTHGAPRDSWWIDMESGVRTFDRFDLAKVRAVLEAAKPYVAKG